MEESRLLGWSVENFMSIKKAWVEFDDSNIINFKGYNDSGKSAMLTALRVLMTNSTPTKQVSFIRDDESYFRVVAKFSDGVEILRDKYANGQSLYEMYQGGVVLFSTKVNNVLTKVDKVPQPIADYLGLITFNGVCLNARACFEKQIGVQTTGSENYQMFSAVLRSEEIAAAGSMINTDRNKLASDIAALDSDLRVMRGLCDNRISEGLVDNLKAVDGGIDVLTARGSEVQDLIHIQGNMDAIQIAPHLDSVDFSQANQLMHIQGFVDSMDAIQIPPQLDRLDSSRLSELMTVNSLSSQLDTIQIPPQLTIVDLSQLDLLSTIGKLSAECDAFSIPPELQSMNSSRLSALLEIQRLVEGCLECETIANNLELELDEYKDTLVELEDATRGQFVRCPNCGTMVSVGEEHTHT